MNRTGLTEATRSEGGRSSPPWHPVWSIFLMVLWGFEPQSLDHKTERRTTGPQNLVRDVIYRMCRSLMVGCWLDSGFAKRKTRDVGCISTGMCTTPATSTSDQFQSCFVCSEVPFRMDLHGSGTSDNVSRSTRIWNSAVLVEYNLRP